MNSTYRPGFREHGFILLVSLVGAFVVIFGITALNRSTAADTPSNPAEITGVSVTTAEPPPPAPPASPFSREGAASPRDSVPALAALPPSTGGPAIALPDLVPARPSFSPDNLVGSLDQLVLTEETADRGPEVLSGGLIYPESARNRNIEGKTVVSILIGSDGIVRDAHILESDPPGVFDQAVLQAVANWRFKPAVYGGEPVSVWAKVPISFTLEED